MDYQCNVRFQSPEPLYMRYVILEFFLCLPVIILKRSSSLPFSSRFLKASDRFNDLAVSVYVTAGHILHIIQLTGWMQNIEF